MSLPPVTTPPVPGTTATLPRFTIWEWVWVVVLTPLISYGYLRIDIDLDPALLPHSILARSGPVLLLLVGVGFVLSWATVYELRTNRSRVEQWLNRFCYHFLGPVLPIMAIVWIDPYQPSILYASMFFYCFGLAAIGMTPFGLSLVFGMLMARRRQASKGAAEHGMPGGEEIVGLGPLTWAATGIWLLATVSASVYGMWLAQTNPYDNASLLMSSVIICSAIVLASAGVGWIWWCAARYARQTGDTALLASAMMRWRWQRRNAW